MTLSERLLGQLNRLQTLAQRHHVMLWWTLIGFCFLMLFSAGVYSIHYSWTSLRDARASIDWPTAEGTIVLSRRFRSNPNAPPGRIEYVYTVGDVAYSSDVVLFGQGYTSDHFRSYPAGTTVTVTYDPDDVTNAVLEPGEFNNFAPFYFGGGVLLFCGCVILTGVYQMARTVYRAFRKQSE